MSHYDIKSPVVHQWPYSQRQMRSLVRDEQWARFRKQVPEMVLVNIMSPKRSRRAAWHMARYFRREFGYDFVQYGHDGEEDDESHEAYLWTNPFLAIDRIVFGACCFRKRETSWALQWVWIHPYERRKGNLSKAWPHFRDRYGDFDVEGPYSMAMVGFLKGMRNATGAKARKGAVVSQDCV